MWLHPTAAVTKAAKADLVSFCIRSRKNVCPEPATLRFIIQHNNSCSSFALEAGGWAGQWACFTCLLFSVYCLKWGQCRYKFIEGQRSKKHILYNVIVVPRTNSLTFDWVLVWTRKGLYEHYQAWLPFFRKNPQAENSRKNGWHCQLFVRVQPI
jgi:hypothetical protein